MNEPPNSPTELTDIEYRIKRAQALIKATSALMQKKWEEAANFYHEALTWSAKLATITEMDIKIILIHQQSYAYFLNLAGHWALALQAYDKVYHNCYHWLDYDTITRDEILIQIHVASAVINAKQDRWRETFKDYKQAFYLFKSLLLSRILISKENRQLLSLLASFCAFACEKLNNWKKAVLYYQEAIK